MNFIDRFTKNTQISNVIKIYPVGAELFHVNKQMNRHDGANSHFSVNVPKN